MSVCHSSAIFFAPDDSWRLWFRSAVLRARLVLRIQPSQHEPRVRPALAYRLVQPLRPVRRGRSFFQIGEQTPEFLRGILKRGGIARPLRSQETPRILVLSKIEYLLLAIYDQPMPRLLLGAAGNFTQGSARFALKDGNVH